MIPEEMERLMQFILEQQAQLTVKHAQAEERMSRLEEAQHGLLRTQQTTQEAIQQTQETIQQVQENTARQIEHLGNALVALTEAHERTQVALKELAESQAHSDRRLDALIDIVRGGKDTGQT